MLNINVVIMSLLCLSQQNSIVNNQFQSPIVLYTLHVSNDDQGLIDFNMLQYEPQYKQVILLQYSSYNFTVSAINKIAEWSKDNPSVVMSKS